MQSVFCTFEYKMKAGHFVQSFFVWVRGLFAAVDGSVVMPVKQCVRLRAKRGKQGFARKTMRAVTGKMTKTGICP